MNPPPVHPTEIRTLISPSSVVELNTTSALANYATEASEKKLFSSLHHWLLLADDNFTIEDNINIPLNSHVAIATEQKYDSSEGIVLRDVYKLSQSWPMIFSPPRIWLPGQPFPPSPSRQDFQGLVIKAGIVIEKETLEHQNEYKQNHLWNKVSYGPMQLVSRMLNFRMHEVLLDSWGLLNPNGTFTGLMGLMQSGECDIGGVQCLISPERLGAVDFAAETFPFRQPSLSSVANIYILPFSVAAWVTYGTVMVVLTVILFTTEKFERNIMKYPVSQPSEDWSGALLDSIGIICQQEPKSAVCLHVNIVTLFHWAGQYQFTPQLLLISFAHIVSPFPFLISIHQPPRGKVKDDQVMIANRDVVHIPPTFHHVHGLGVTQSCESTPDNISPRIIFLFLHLLSTFFFTSYSAIIVSLLQTPSSSINTLSDLMKSPLKIIMHDISYNSKYKEYINDSTSPLVKELFHQRVLSQPKQKVFVTMGQGVELIRTGSYAFHADVNTYTAISNTWLETEKCSIKEVYMYPEFKGGIPIQKGSPYKEHISQKLRWLKEVGLMEREWKLWISQKPKCQKHDTEFTSVGFQDFYPALMVLAYGLLFASVLMLMEIFFTKSLHIGVHTIP
uniref:Ionotropic glutamate receptor C-terminal domain-containing protein n=1 Tax=Timema poppense TaxID=170557 RepID=A0A7R9DKD4_TIMPO|nr:unnamed protein product [Timema poppensis]